MLKQIAGRVPLYLVTMYLCGSMLLHGCRDESTGSQSSKGSSGADGETAQVGVSTTVSGHENPASPSAKPGTTPPRPKAEESKNTEVLGISPYGDDTLRSTRSGSPASVPTTSASVQAFAPLQDAVRGEWADYETLGGGRLRYEIIATRIATVITRVETWMEGKPLGEPALREDDRSLDSVAALTEHDEAARSCRPDVIELGGRRWNVLLYEDRWTEEEVAYVRRTWVSPEVPVFGLLRLELHGDGQLEARLNLTGWGVK